MRITDQNYESYALDYIEGTLAGEQRRAFDAFLESHPERAAEIRALQFSMPVLTPDESVRFAGKASLRRHASLGVWVLRATAVAAVLALALWIAGIDRPRPVEPVQVAADLPATQPEIQPTASEPVAARPAVEPIAAPAPVPRIRKAAPVFHAPQVALLAVHRTPVVIAVPPTVLSEAELAAQEAVIEAQIADFEPYTDAYFAETLPVDDHSSDDDLLMENDRLGFLNLLNRNRMKLLAVDILRPVSELNPIRVYENDTEKVVEFASITLHRDVAGN